MVFTYSNSTLPADQFFDQHPVVFITGGTGFVGKTLLEKILRSLPQVSKIYLLVRISGSQTLTGRVRKEILDSRIFETLKAQFSSQDDFNRAIASKIIPVQGDITLDHLGLSEQDMAMIRTDTHIVINSAASVSFDDPLGNALELNTKGPLRTIAFASTIPQIAAIVHISTCYTNSFMKGTLDEKVYPHPFGEPEEIYKQLMAMSYEDLRNYERKRVLKTYPNTYTFTKSLTEHLITLRYKTMGLPIVICRPSIISAAVAEPVPGWVEGVAASNKAVVATALGQVQEWISAPTNKTDLVPVDYVVKLILMAVTVADRHLDAPPIFQAATSSINALTWGMFATYNAAYWRAVPRPRRRIAGITDEDVRMELFSAEEFKARFEVRFGPLIRQLGQLKEQDSKRMKARISQALAVPTMFRHFSTGDWVFDATLAMRLDDGAPKSLKCGLRRGMDWHQYMQDYLMGVHEFILRERVDRSVVIDYEAIPEVLPPKLYQMTTPTSTPAALVAAPKPEIPSRL